MKFRFALLIAIALLLALARLSVGPHADAHGVIHFGFALPTVTTIPFRLSAVLGAAVIGLLLALAGLALQALLRNPLASPFTLGVSSGASFGVACVLALAATTGLSTHAFGGEFTGALFGAAFSLMLVWILAKRASGRDAVALALAGVVLGGVMSSGAMLLEQIVPRGLRGDLLAWMAGRIPELPDPSALVALWILGLLALIVLWKAAHLLDLLMLDDDEATAAGVRLAATRGGLFIIGGLLAAAAVSFAGPIGFVGLVAPHTARLFIGHRHRLLVPSTALCGVIVVLSADLLRQGLDVGTGRLPVGVITALAGGPFFLWLLSRSRRGGSEWNL
ncbi:MAG: iron ABC transporter permease [Phycisphaerales bacterium]|nr:iron ABC transporter permease [Phycisphaerales bacterium]